MDAAPCPGFRSVPDGNIGTLCTAAPCAQSRLSNVASDSPYAPALTMTQSQGLAAWIAIAALCFALYLPGVDGPYLLDDYAVIVHNPDLRLEQFDWAELKAAMFSRESGPLYRPLGMLSFALSYTWASDSAAAIKWGNVLIHLATGAALFLLALRLARMLLPRGRSAEALPVALLASGLWLLHPLHVSTVLYAVQRLAGLAALFTVLSMLWYLHGRERFSRNGRGLFSMLSAIVLGGTVALLSKETGALLVFYLLVVEWVVFRFEPPSGMGPMQTKVWRSSLWIPAAGVFGVLAYKGFSFANGVPFRDFTVGERLLTESRVVLFYVREILLPRVADMGLFHEVQISRGLFHPITTVWAVAAVACAASAAAWAVVRHRVLPLAFGVAWFFAGHLLESTVIPLEPVFEHRNYLASFGPLFTVGCYLVASATSLARHRLIRVAFPAVFLVYLAGQLDERTQDWSSGPRFLETELMNHPDAARAWGWAGLHLAQSGLVEQGASAYRRAMELDGDDAGYGIELLRATTDAGLPLPQDIVARVLNTIERHGISTHAANQLVLWPMGRKFPPQIKPHMIAIYEAALESPRWPSERQKANTSALLSIMLCVDGKREVAEERLAKARGNAWDRLQEGALVCIESLPSHSGGGNTSL